MTTCFRGKITDYRIVDLGPGGYYMCGIDTAKCCQSEEVYANLEIYIEIKTSYSPRGEDRHYSKAEFHLKYNLN
jgi:hypothetical protein